MNGLEIGLIVGGIGAAAGVAAYFFDKGVKKALDHAVAEAKKDATSFGTLAYGPGRSAQAPGQLKKAEDPQEPKAGPEGHGKENAPGQLKKESRG